MKQMNSMRRLIEKLRTAAKKEFAPHGRIRTAAGDLAALLLGFLFGKTALPGGCAPLGAGLLGACGDSERRGALATVGVMVGSVGGFGLFHGLRYASAALLIYATLFLLRGLRIACHSWFAPLAAGLMTALVGAVYLRFGSETGVTFFSWLAEAVLAGGACMLFRAALRRDREDARSRVGMAALGMCVILSLGGFLIAETVSVGRCLAAFAVLAAAYLGGAAGGGLMGLLLGLSLDAAAATPGICTLALGCAGAMGGLFSGHGKVPNALGCILGNAAAAFWAADSLTRTGLLYEFFIASVLFLLLPARFYARLRLPTEAPSAAGLLHYLQGRAGLAASAFSQLSALLRETPEAGRSDEDLLSAFDVAAEEVCRGCAERERCWGRQYETTRSAMQEASGPMRERGKVLPADFPLWFRDHCPLIQPFCDSVSREWKAVLRRRQMKKRLKNDRALISRQYADFAQLLRDLTALSRDSIREELRLTRQLERFLRDYAPGTQASVFRDGNGRLHAELSGTGRMSLTRRSGWLAEISRALGVEMVCPDSGSKRLQLFEREPLEAEIGVAACCRGGQSPSGDVSRSFKTPEGILYLIVADGMGSGKEAAEESADASELAEKLLRAGASPETVMRMLNTALILRSERRLTTLSLDLMRVNLFSGETCVYKYGAAPSYVREGREVRTIPGQSPAAGLDDVGPDCTRLRLSSGGAAVILSDGAAKADTVSERLLECVPGALQELAGTILREAAARSGWEDDMTVLTLSLTKRDGLEPV